MLAYFSCFYKRVPFLWELVKKSSACHNTAVPELHISVLERKNSRIAFFSLMNAYEEKRKALISLTEGQVIKAAVKAIMREGETKDEHV